MKVILASRNQGKLREFRAIFKGVGLDLIPVTDFPDVEDIKETGDTFLANARLKAHGTAQAAGLPALADDSGLAVAALDGAPGVFSARYAGSHGDDEANWRKVLAELGDRPPEERTAAFVCVLVLAWPDGRELIARGRLEGRIGFAPAGENGFGYDPIMYLPEHGLTVAQLSAEAKNAISHRGRAALELKKLIEAQGLGD